MPAAPGVHGNTLFFRILVCSLRRRTQTGIHNSQTLVTSLCHGVLGVSDSSCYKLIWTTDRLMDYEACFLS